MILKAYQVTMYRCVLDSGKIDVTPLTVLVGQNESGKTALLKALHKFNPFKQEPYVMDIEWPRGRRRERKDTTVVCRCWFEIENREISELETLTTQKHENLIVEITRDYGGRFEVYFPEGICPDKFSQSDTDKIIDSFGKPTTPVGVSFSSTLERCLQEIRTNISENSIQELEKLQAPHTDALRKSLSPNNPEKQNEEQFTNDYANKLKSALKTLGEKHTIYKTTKEYVLKHIPTFIYMDDYKTFHGTALLNQVKERKDQNKLTDEDKTLLMILGLSGLNIDAECQKAAVNDREQRQYDLDDASKTLTREISERWKQKKYEVQFRADGHQFFTMVQDNPNVGLIRLEERSKGFQWFFSFDLTLMHESKGTFKGCVLLLDEPGLHLHPDGQKDLLGRLDNYAQGNTMIYTTHLPFMIELRNPERIRVISETPNGTTVSDDLNKSQPGAKLTLQAALGMSGRSSYLVAQRNLVVEGADDSWIITELSNLLERTGEKGLNDDIYITAAGGAPEAVYITTFMIGQELQVVTLFDSDKAGNDARDKLINKWITKYKGKKAEVVNLGEAVGEPNKDYALEDIFPESYYLNKVKVVYEKQMAIEGMRDITLNGSDQLCKRVERALEQNKITFNKGSVAKLIRKELSHMKNATELPPGVKDKAIKLINKINAAMDSLK